MAEILLFEREEVSFQHEEDDYIYAFQRFDAGKITFRRLWPACPTQDESIILPPGSNNDLANVAVIVLYKAAETGQSMNGFFPVIIKAILGVYNSKDVAEVNLRKAINSFPTRNPIAEVNKVMEFIEPYASWTNSNGSGGENTTPTNGSLKRKLDPPAGQTPSPSEPPKKRQATPPVSFKVVLPANSLARSSSVPVNPSSSNGRSTSSPSNNPTLPTPPNSASPTKSSKGPVPVIRVPVKGVKITKPTSLAEKMTKMVHMHVDQAKSTNAVATPNGSQSSTNPPSTTHNTTQNGAPKTPSPVVPAKAVPNSKGSPKNSTVLPKTTNTQPVTIAPASQTPTVTPKASNTEVQIRPKSATTTPKVWGSMPKPPSSRMALRTGHLTPNRPSSGASSTMSNGIKVVSKKQTSPTPKPTTNGAASQTIAKPTETQAAATVETTKADAVPVSTEKPSDAVSSPSLASSSATAAPVGKKITIKLTPQKPLEVIVPNDTPSPVSPSENQLPITPPSEKPATPPPTQTDLSKVLFPTPKTSQTSLNINASISKLISTSNELVKTGSSLDEFFEQAEAREEEQRVQRKKWFTEYVANLTTENENLQTFLKNQIEKYEATNAELVKLEVLNGEQADRLKRLETDNTHLRTDLTAIQTEKSNAKSKISEANGKVDTMKKESDQVKKQLTTLQSENKSLEDNLKEITRKFEKLKTDRWDAEKRISKLTDQLGVETTKRITAEQTLKKKVEELEKMNHEELERLRKENEELKSEKNALEQWKSTARAFFN